MALNERVEAARNFLFRRRYVYVTTFNGPLADEVLADLAKFCRAHASTGNADPYIAARLDGRREVWLRIQTHLKLNPEQLWALYNGGAAA